MLKSSKLFVVVAILALSAGAAMAQPLPTAPVPLDIGGDPGDPWVGGAQGTNEVGIGDPANGYYDVLINGYIGAYARVSAYDNWINFGVMSPTDGTYDVPAIRYARIGNGVPAGLLDGEEGSTQTNLAAFTNAGTDFANHDCAGIQIQTNARLDLAIQFDSVSNPFPGYMRRVDETGVVFAGRDTRRLDGADYQLRNQMKMAFRGRFLNYVDTTDPDARADGVRYTSITSGQTTDYGNWTNWSSAGNAIETAADGWFEPTTGNDPWRGEAARPQGTALLQSGAALDVLNLVVERGQAQESAAISPVAGDAAAAEVLFASRILRRGLQDVQGNYRSDILVTLSYRDGDVDAQWNPTPK